MKGAPREIVRILTRPAGPDFALLRHLFALDRQGNAQRVVTLRARLRDINPDLFFICDKSDARVLRAFGLIPQRKPATV